MSAFTVLGAIATIVAAVLTAAALRTSGSVDGRAEATATATGTVTADVVPSPDAPSTAPSDPRPGPGTCLGSDAGDPVPCATGHRYEIFSTDDCSETALIRYLGGLPGVEDVRVVPGTLPRGDRDVCVLSDRDGQPLTSGARNALQGEDHSHWRRCVDARLGGAVVPCSEVHTGELVRAEPGSGVVDCAQAAADYLDARMSDLASRLQVVTLQTAEGPRCLVQTRGADLLDGSLRNIGSGSPPFVQN